MPDVSRFLVPPGAGEVIWEGPIGTTVKVAAAAVGGLISICEMPVAPGYMVPPHTHGDTDEYSYVLEGTIGARIGDDELSAGPGSWILKPRGIMHTFWNAGPEQATILEILVPGRFEGFFRRSSALARDGVLTDDALASLAAEYATAVSMDWVPDLTARYGLEVDI
jgi:mannose-6-phosphate isomerase-like protein (cupin superfamily)